LSLFLPLIAGVGGEQHAARMAAGKPTNTIFGAPIMVNDVTTNDQGAPTTISLPARDVFIAWQDARSGSEDIYVPKPHNNGTNFAPNKRADDATGTSKHIEPAAAATVNGTILLTWQDNRRSVFDYDIYFAKSYNDGANFTKNIKVDDSNSTSISWQERPSIATTTGGAIYIAWTDDRTIQLRVRGAWSIDGGNTFSPSKEISPLTSSYGQTGVSLAANGDRIFAAFVDNTTSTGKPHPYLCISTDGGKTFSAPVRLDSSGNGGWQMSVSIAPMPGGGIVAVWEDLRNGNGDIYACIVSSNGTITTPDFRVDDDTTGAYQLDPSVAADQLGDIHVTWQDERNGLYAIRYAYRQAGGNQFSSSMEVASPGANDIQRRAVVTAADPGRVFVTYEDDKRGDYDVYLSAGDVPFILDLGSGWNFISLPRIGYGYNASTLGLTTGDTVAQWNPDTQTYKSYVVGVPVNDFSILPNTGYWINVPSGTRTLTLFGSFPTTYQSRTITVPSGGGWATVGFSLLDTSRHAKDIPSMFSVPGSITTIASYNQTTQTYTSWVSVIPDLNNFALLPGQAYWIMCRSSGVLNYTVQPRSFVLSLATGWNFVSAPLVGYGYKASTLGLMAGDTVAQWNPSTRVYQSYVVGVPVNDFTIAPTTGYWVNIPTGTRTLVLYGGLPNTNQSRTITLPSGGGWVTIGFAGLNMTRHASDIPEMFSGGNSSTITTIAAYNPVTRAYSSWLSVIPTMNNFLLVPGQAYWILCSGSGTLTYAP
jgi:hypothetical protein